MVLKDGKTMLPDRFCRCGVRGVRLPGAAGQFPKLTL